MNSALNKKLPKYNCYLLQTLQSFTSAYSFIPQSTIIGNCAFIKPQG